MLRAVRLTGAVYFDFELSSPWVAEAPPSRELAAKVMPGAQRVIEYHVIARGVVLGPRGRPANRCVCARGTSSCFPRAMRTCCRARPGMRAAPDMSRFARRSTPLPIVYELGGGGPERARHRVRVPGLRRASLQSVADRAADGDPPGGGGPAATTGWLGTLLKSR